MDTTQFNDTDMQKLYNTAPQWSEMPTPEEDDMLEDIFGNENQQDAEPIAEEDVQTEDPMKGLESEDAKASEEVSEGSDYDFDDSWLSDEVKAILDGIGDDDEDQDQAAMLLKRAIEESDIQWISSAFGDYDTIVQEKDRKIESLLRQIASEREQSDRLLDENLLSQTSNREMSKIYDVVDGNPLLKDVVVYSMRWEDESYRERLKDAVTNLFEEVVGVSVSDLLESKKQADKLGMEENTYGTTGAAPKKWSLGGMLEEL